MARVMLTGRVTEAQLATLKGYAEAAGLPLYQATVRALELGIAALVAGKGGEATAETNASDVDELASLRDAIDRLAIRAELTDRVVQRTLYAAGAAYAAALAGPGQGEGHLAQIAQDADRIYERQLARARDG